MQPNHIVLLRRALLAIFITFLGAVVYSYYTRASRREQSGNTGPILDADIKRSTEKIQFSEHRDGRVLFKVSAQKLVEKAAKNILQTVEVVNFGTDGTRKDTIQSDYCEYSQANDTVVFNGNVVVKVQGGTEIRSNTLHYDKGSDMVRTSERFTMQDKGITGEGVGLRYHFASQSFRIEKQVRLQMKNADSNKGPGGSVVETRIQAESADYERTAHRLTMTGNVSAVQETGQLQGQRLDIQFGPDDRAVQYLEAVKNASYKMGTGPAQSDLQGQTIRMFFANGASTPERIETSGDASFRSQNAQRQDTLTAQQISMALAQSQLQTMEARTGATLTAVSPESRFELGGEKLSATFAGQGGAALETLRLETQAQFRSFEGGEPAGALQAERIAIRFVHGGAGQGIKEVTAAQQVDWQFKKPTEPAKPKDKKPQSDPDQRRLRSEQLQVLYQADGIHLSELHAKGHCLVELIPSRPQQERKKIQAEKLDMTFFPRADQMEKVFAQEDVKVITVAADKNNVDRVTTSDKLVAQYSPDGTLQTMEQDGHFRFTEGKRKGASDRARYEETKELLYLIGSPKIEEDGSTTTAKEMVFDRKDKILRAGGQVRTRQVSNGDRGLSAPFAASKEPTLITSQTLEMRDKEGVAIYRGNAWVRQEDNFVHAEIVEIFNAKQELIAQTRVSSQTQFANDPKGGASPRAATPTKIQADRMHYLQKDQRIRYEKNVKLIQAGSEIVADAADLFLEGKDNRIEKAYFKNRVFIKQPEREGRGDEAEYYAKEDKIILVGNLAQVDSKSKGKSSGKRLTIYNNGDRIFIE